ncbi:MAG: hypothetical protein QM781_03395 [Chitinophagaceae bacterium]
MKVSLLQSLVLFTLLLSGMQATAQIKPFSLGPYLERAWLTENHSITHKDGLGIGLSADIRLSERIGLTGSAGYLQFSGRSTPEGKADAVKAYPVRAGLKFRPAPFIYFKMETGPANLKNESGNTWLLSPGVGVRLLGLDIQGKYEVWPGKTDLSFWGLRVAFHI